ncbi:hypothetical protein VN97_g1839 [Penicillium thymicola]|uniref:Uncharacterized protein n=1 Tax=Penicillium thymicola TaxID=293382 RepID=A0AAI9TQ92_PENTH|nr:hypothetical protein VN97_g1839 [Penicillium thymicola]
MDISSALELLRNAPAQALQNHRNEAVAACREIEARLRDFDSTHHEAVYEATSVQLRSSVNQPALSGQVARMSPTNSTKLLNALKKTSTWVWQSIKLQPNEVFCIKRPRVRDRRLADVRRVEGDHKAENKYKLLRGLAQRSFALQGEKSGYLDIERLCKIASSRGKDKLNRGRQGKIASYVTYELAIEEEDKRYAIRAIQAGMRQLVMERLLEERLGEAGQCDTASGISAFTALTVRPFRCLKYGEIPEFLDCLLESASMNLSVSENEQEISIADVIKETSVWYDQLQIYYNKVVGNRAELEKHQSNKRIRVRTSSSANDHTTSPNELSRLSHQLTASDQAAIQCAIRSPSLCIGENGSIHYRCTSSEGSSDSFDEVSDIPESNLSNPHQNMGQGTTDAECASNNTTQINKLPSTRIPRSGTGYSRASMPGMMAWPDIPLMEPAPVQTLQSNSDNSWANSIAMTASHVPSDRPLIDIPQPDASDAWANSTAMAAGRVPSDINDIPQPDANDAWASSTGMEAIYFPSDRPLVDIPQPDASDAWANSTGMAAAYFPSDRPLIDIPQPDASDAWANPYSQIPENTSLDPYMGNVPHPDANDAEEPTTVEAPQSGSSNSWANSAGMAAVQFVSNSRNAPHPGARDAWPGVSARDSASSQTSHSDSNALWNRAEVTPAQRPAEVPRANGKAQPITGNWSSHILPSSSLQPPNLRDQPENGQYSRAVTVN